MPEIVKLLEGAVLTGSRVRIEPLNAELHGEQLWEGSSGSANDRLWQYLWEGPFADKGAFLKSVEEKASSHDPFFVAIVEAQSGRAIGRAAYLRNEPAHKVIEVGHILFTPELQRTASATEAMYLMAGYVFDQLRYRRYEWKCDALNAPSRTAALRLGFTFEGIFRQHMLVKGRNRDTAWFSMLDSEWPTRKAAFEAWLEPGNFNEMGTQKRPLAQLRNNW